MLGRHNKPTKKKLISREEEPHEAKPVSVEKPNWRILIATNARKVTCTLRA